MRINNNVVAFNAFRNVTTTETALGKSLEKLSSGFRINRAADDAAGLVISQKLRYTVSGMKVATRNAQDGVSVVQTAEGALAEVHNILQRMRDLAVQSLNSAANDETAVSAAQAEVDALVSEIQRINDTTSFGGTKLLDGSYSEKLFQVGDTAGAVITVSVSTLTSATFASLTVNGTSSMATIDTAIANVSAIRGKLGALQNRFESTIANLTTTTENLSASESRIRDTDMAQEMVNFTRHQVLLQAGTAMLAQANQIPQATLRLLQ
ncbi:MAG: flagellin [Acidimicrobiia bacterium]